MSPTPTCLSWEAGSCLLIGVNQIFRHFARQGGDTLLLLPAILFLVNVICTNGLSSCLNETPDKFLPPAEISGLGPPPVYFLVDLTSLVCFRCFPLQWSRSGPHVRSPPRPMAPPSSRPQPRDLSSHSFPPKPLNFTFFKYFLHLPTFLHSHYPYPIPSSVISQGDDHSGHVTHLCIFTGTCSLIDSLPQSQNKLSRRKRGRCRPGPPSPGFKVVSQGS